ncbi:hypothetical protein swp_4523 [Shewanella piezotolerans WP3]|uniref:Uncharacterized protein n=1 Tax=Shewanella piezotolerans (strain WP3 / JCM 13877) TaxID=225849 RepID=B8CUH5_SHEPW|nr:hypothetical protein swp_4523 [Shewanella piezotolerans WP3]
MLLIMKSSQKSWRGVAVYFVQKQGDLAIAPPELWIEGLLGSLLIS